MSTSDGCYEKAKARGDETFTLVGQDLSSPRVICEWLKENIDKAPERKLREAFECALRMRTTRMRKSAD